MKLLNKFITRKKNNVETYYYHYDLVIWNKTRHVMLFRNENVYFRQKKEHLYIGFGMAQLVYWYFFLQKFMLA